MVSSIHNHLSEQQHDDSFAERVRKDAIPNRANGAICPKAKSSLHPPPSMVRWSAMFWATTSPRNMVY